MSQSMAKIAKIMAKVPDMVKEDPVGWQDTLFTEIYNTLGQRECTRIANEMAMHHPEFLEWLRIRGETL